MNCSAARTQLSEFIDRELAPAASRAVAAHVRECGACSRTLIRL